VLRRILPPGANWTAATTLLDELELLEMLLELVELLNELELLDEAPELALEALLDELELFIGGMLELPPPPQALRAQHRIDAVTNFKMTKYFT